MWIRRQIFAQARMPSMRPQAPSARLPVAPATPARGGIPTDVQAASPEESPAEAAARAGGFHESSYELQHGLQVSESEWPDDVTVPAALGDR